MKAWTLDQLKFAHDVCFPDRFYELWAKYRGHREALFHVGMFKSYGGLLPWIFMYSRDNFKNHSFGETIDKVLTELIGDYGAPPSAPPAT